MHKNNDVTRRDFLQAAAAVGGLAATGAALTSLPARAAPPDFKPWRETGRVVQVRDERALSRMGAMPKPEPVRAMVERAVCALTGKRTRDEAFAALVHPEDIVGIKPNCLAGRFMSTNKEVVEAVVDGLLAVGVKPDHIIVWEQQRSILGRGRMRARTEPGKVQYTAFMTSYPRGHYGPEQRHGAGPSRYCEIVHRVSAIINLPVFKDHSIAGITVSMKNLTHGTINNPFEYHHRNNGEIAHIYAHPLLAGKVRLTLADALRVEYNGGPNDSSHKALHHSLYASTDPVAMDSVALAVIEGMRRDKGFPPLAKAGRAATHVETAQDLGLGVAEAGKIRLERFQLG
jgi:uncharacterized protein (DUF362 family)